MNLSAATPTPERAVRIAGRSCIAPVAVRQMRTMQQAALQAFMNMAVIYSKKESNVPL